MNRKKKWSVRSVMHTVILKSVCVIVVSRRASSVSRLGSHPTPIRSLHARTVPEYFLRITSIPHSTGRSLPEDTRYGVRNSSCPVKKCFLSMTMRWSGMNRSDGVCALNCCACTRRKKVICEREQTQAILCVRSTH